jgi:hypothetical protein
LTPLEKQQYDGVMGMGGFKQKYEENPTSQFVLGDANYAKFKAVADAEKAIPEKGLFSIFSSASAAEPDRISSVSGTPGFQTVVNSDGTISIVPVDTSSSLPFNVGDRLFNQFNTATTAPNQTSFDPRSLQSIFPTNVQTGIMTQAPLQNLGFDTSLGVANEEDVEQVDYLGSKPNKVQTGIAKLFEFLQRFSPVANVARGIESIRNRFDTRKAIQRDIQRDTQGAINNVVSPRIMNMQPTAQDRGRGSIPSRSSPTTSRRDTSPSSSYSQASYARRR